MEESRPESISRPLPGQVAVVTGGSRGIGAATARLLARNGVRVAVNGRDVAALDGVVADIRTAGGTAIGVAADCTDAEALEGLRERVESELGPVSILAAFAGGNGRPRRTEEVSPQEWRTVIDGDLTATFLSIRAVLPGMIERGYGCIVTMGSAAGRLPSQASAAYAAAKAGVIMLSKHLANELGRHGIRVNCLTPSAVMNEKMAANMSEAQREQLAAAFPLGRIGRAEDIAEAALFLVSERASWITGVTLDISGGRIIV